MARPKVKDDERKQLPARSSRGTRIRQLVGEEADADASFWGQDAWREDGEDADYSTEEGARWCRSVCGSWVSRRQCAHCRCMVTEEEDIVDSDFDEREDPDEDVHDEDAERDGDVAAAAGRKRGVYREPMKQAAQALLAKKPRVVPPAPASSAAVAAVGSSTSQVATPPPPAVFQYEAPTVRRSTARKSSESSELRRRATEEAARGRRVSDAAAAAAGGGHSQLGGARLTQAQLLAEAVRTEVENIQSLSRLEQLEEEKKAESITPKAPFTGRMVRFHSRVGAPKTITFLNSVEFPALFHQQPKPKKRERPSQQQQQEEDERLEDGERDERERRGSGANEISASDVALTAQ